MRGVAREQSVNNAEPSGRAERSGYVYWSDAAGARHRSARLGTMTLVRKRMARRVVVEKRGKWQLARQRRGAWPLRRFFPNRPPAGSCVVLQHLSHICPARPPRDATPILSHPAPARPPSACPLSSSSQPASVYLPAVPRTRLRTRENGYRYRAADTSLRAVPPQAPAQPSRRQH